MRVELPFPCDTPNYTAPGVAFPPTRQVHHVDVAAPVLQVRLSQRWSTPEGREHDFEQFLSHVRSGAVPGLTEETARAIGGESEPDPYTTLTFYTKQGATSLYWGGDGAFEGTVYEPGDAAPSEGHAP